MKLAGSYTFAAPRETVWELLNDPAMLCRIIPGCQRLEQIGEDSYAADIKLGIAGVRGDYSGTVKISDQQPPERYHLEGEGKGKPGFAKGAGDVDLSAEADGRTTMRYSGTAQVGGAVAGIGQRLIEGAAKSIINQSLKALSAELEQRVGTLSANLVPEAGGEARATAPAVSTSMPASGTAEGGGEAIGAEAARAPLEQTLALATGETAALRPPSPQRPSGPEGDGRVVSQPSVTRAGEGLSAVDVVRGMADDLLTQQPYLRWLLPLAAGVLLGLLLGRGRTMKREG